MPSGGKRKNSGKKKGIYYAAAAAKESSSQTQLPFAPKKVTRKKNTTKSSKKQQENEGKPEAAPSPSRVSKRIAERSSNSNGGESSSSQSPPKSLAPKKITRKKNTTKSPPKKQQENDDIPRAAPPKSSSRFSNRIAERSTSSNQPKGDLFGIFKAGKRKTADAPEEPPQTKQNLPKRSRTTCSQTSQQASSKKSSRVTKKSKDEKDGNKILNLYFNMRDPCKPSANELYGDDDSDCDDNDDDFVSELDDESDIDLEADNLPNRASRVQYQPPKGSPLEKFLDSQKEVIKLKLKNGGDRKWFFSDCTPTVSGRCDPKRYYCGNVIIYAHDPLKHHGNQISGDPNGSPSKFSCVHCKKTGALNGHSWHYRPAHYGDSVVWILHRRYECKKQKKTTDDGACGCGKTFANFHPVFMEQLPNVVSETFPFLMTVGGLGMHISMMNQFMVVCTKGIMFGTYASMVNESKKMKYFYDHRTYLDNLRDRMEQLQQTRESGFEVRDPDLIPFSPFNTPGEYNGILLKASLVKALFLKVMRTLEEYLQASFQLNLDESESPDHSFKFAKMIMSFVRSGKIWTGTYDSVSLKGLVTMNFFCHTKSNDEIHAAICDNKKIREFTGAPDLKRIEGDGGGDASAWTSVYSASLLDNTNPYREMWNEGLPRARLNPKSICTFDDSLDLERWAKAFMNGIEDGIEDSGDGTIYYGLDTEQNRDGKTKTIQLCFPSRIYTKIVVVDLGSMKISRKADFEKQLRHFSTVLTHEKLIPVAVQISHDVKHLLELGIDRGNNKVIDLGNVAKQLEPSHPDGFSLQKLSARYLKYYVSKEFQTSNWDSLTENMVEYAALDAYLHLRLYEEIQNLVILARKNGTLPVHASLPSFNLGRRVNMLFNGQTVGSGTLEFIGGSGGETKKFGDVTVGRGKSIVSIDTPTQKPSFPSKGYLIVKEDQGLCIRCREKLLSAFEKHAADGQLQVICSTSNLAVFMDPSQDEEKTVVASKSSERDENDDDQTSLLNLCTTDPIVLPTKATEEAPASKLPHLPASSTQMNKMPDSQRSHEDGLHYADDVVVGEHILPISRTFMDRFHVFDAFPSSRDADEKAALNVIRRMAFSTVTSFDEEDLSDVVKFLREKRNIDHLNDIIDDFFFNREWWYQRVKAMIFNNDHLKKFWTAKLDKWFDTLMRLCREGKLEETTDCVMFQWVGRDRNGLNLYLRRRGSNRSELLHQKMRVAFGPHGVGAEVGHYLLLWITYRFNVSTGIRRLNHHNFGIHQLHLIDRIQTRYAQVFDCDVFPQHTNQIHKKTIPGLVPVGIRPLDYDEVYVKKGPCHVSLRGDLRFIAERSGVVCPPIPISHPKEKKIFNNFMLNQKKLSNKCWDQLASKFAMEAEKDGFTTIFPKIPSMLRSYYSTWKLNTEIKWVQKSVNDPLYELLGKFLMKSCDPSKAAVFQKRESSKPKNPTQNELTLLEKTAMESEIQQKTLPLNPLPVPPIVAPFQSQYVPSSAPSGKIEGVTDLRSVAIRERMNAEECTHSFQSASMLLPWAMMFPTQMNWTKRKVNTKRNENDYLRQE